MTNRYVITGSTVVDGSGRPATICDLFIDEGFIVDVPATADYHPGWEVVDGTGWTIAPGFIDAHSHADCGPFIAENDTAKILQGITSEVVGNCGFSLAPSGPKHRGELIDLFERLGAPPLDVGGYSCADLFQKADSLGYVTNYIPLVGCTTIRIAAMGMDARAASARELREMQLLIEEALDAGAFGASSGLIYPPGSYASTQELIELLHVLRPGDVYATHMRNESDALTDAVAEALAIGEGTGAKVQISHHKAAGRPNWGKTADTLRLIAAARERGIDVHQDVYPYTAGCTTLTAALPPEAYEGGDAHLLARLNDAQELEKLEAIVRDGRPGFENFVAMAGYDGILIASSASGTYDGKTVEEIGELLGLSGFETIVHLLKTELLKVTMIIFTMDEVDVRRVLLDEYTAIGTDGIPLITAANRHPRTFGTYPRILGHFVRDSGDLSLEEAVRKMTSLPAQIFNLDTRGVIAPGMIADLVAFDYELIGHNTDYRHANTPPTGIAWVMQSGERVVEQNHYIGERKGKRLRPRSL